MNSIRKTGLILLLVFLLPAVFYSVYEISSLSRNEKVINNIYQNQLDAILYSVNQYSDDVTSSWTTKIESSLSASANTDTLAGIWDMLNVNPDIALIFLADTLESSTPVLFTAHDSLKGVGDKVNESIRSNRLTIERLISYKESGFQKIQPIDLSLNDSSTLVTLIFILNDSFNNKMICGVSIDPAIFIVETLRPKFQMIAGDKFILSAHKKGTNELVYSTLDTVNRYDYTAKAVTKDFWILPDYYLGINMKGKGIDEIVRERTYINLTLILLLDLVLLVGVWFVFRNVKKEIQLAENKSTFVSNVSHEIRTPLSLISMFAETLEMGRVSSKEKQQEYYGIISKETQRLTAIVNKILNFSQVEANKSSYNFKALNLNDVVEEVLKTYSFHMESKGFEYSFTGRDILIVEADKEAMLEVLINVLDNAIKYSENNKFININTGASGSMAFVSIEDHGIGISARDQKHIFDKFYRVSTGDLAGSRGTGLGLSLVRHIVASHHGKIEVKSELGKGTTFFIYLPLKRK